MHIGIKQAAIVLGAGAAMLCGVAAASAGTTAVPAAPNAGGHVVAAAAGASSTAGTVFTPIQPCRIVDTRHQAAGALAPGRPRTVQVSGSTGFSAQGGVSTGCGIPSYATAINYSISAVTPSGAGFFRLWPTGTSEQNATALNFSKNVNITSGASVAVNPSTGAGLYLIDHGTSSQATIDVNGYYAPQIQTGVSSVGALVNPTNRVTSVVKTGTGAYTVTVGNTVTGCSASATPDGGSTSANAYIVGNQVFVKTSSITNSTSTPVTSTIAAADENFHLTVVC
jgi:hypothetical protein